MPKQNDILSGLRAIVDAGGPQTPVRSVPRSTGSISANTGTRRLNRPIPEPEPLAASNPLEAIQPGIGDMLGDLGNIGLGASAPIGTLGKARPALTAFKPKQPMPSENRMSELIGRFGGREGLPPAKLPPMEVPKPLPMDEASRMARADEMGYTQDVYHGTNKQFGEFSDPIRYGGYGSGDFGIHVSSDPGAANMKSTYGIAAPGEPIQPLEVGSQVLPLRAKMNKTLQMPDAGIWRDPNNYVRHLEDNLDESSDPAFMQRLSDEAKKITSVQGADYQQQHALWQHKLKELMQDAGYDSIKYANTVESDGAPSFLLMDPRQLRSRFATFDPKRTNSRDLMASLAAMIGGGAAVSHEPQE